MTKLLRELRVCRADLEEHGGCLDGFFHEDQVLYEGRERVKERGGKMRVRERLLRVRQEDGMGKGKEGNKVCKVME